MNLIPANDCVLVERSHEDTSTSGFIVDNYKERLTVSTVGSDVTFVSPGDTIYFEGESTQVGSGSFIIREKQIVGKNG